MCKCSGIMTSCTNDVMTANTYLKITIKFLPKTQFTAKNESEICDNYDFVFCKFLQHRISQVTTRPTWHPQGSSLSEIFSSSVEADCDEYQDLPAHPYEGPSEPASWILWWPLFLSMMQVSFVWSPTLGILSGKKTYQYPVCKYRSMTRLLKNCIFSNLVPRGRKTFWSYHRLLFG